jgi:hypothetical protein
MSDSTASMWLRMLGLEDLWRVANSSDFQQQIAQLFAAIFETRLRVERIEYKLDALLDRMGCDDIARRTVPLISGQRPGNGAGTHTAAIVAVDAGGGVTTTADRGAGGGVEGAGGSDGTAQWRPY